MGNPPFAPLLFLLPRVYFVSNLECKSRSDRIGNRLIPGVAGVGMMRLSQVLFVVALAVVTAVPSHAMMRSRRGPTAPHVQKKSNKPGTIRHTTFKPGQRGIGDNRATEIQQALIKAGYLNGDPSGHWDSSTEAAMQKLQSDNGWQTKLVPDSRALIKLGLGPHQENPATISDSTVSALGSK
ncbi:peptidoglycan-binding domain-containing protein [Terriglobus sp. YAF25]|uniref:peptidoglycan-binding domain-containing protein n=2 Tax=unclassified Terriglobus TaxID=2628988 RepID=UPI003F9AE221